MNKEILKSYYQMFMKAKKRQKKYDLATIIENTNIKKGTLYKFSRANTAEKMLSFRLNTLFHIFNEIDNLDEKTNKKYSKTLVETLKQWLDKLKNNSDNVLNKIKHYDNFDEIKYTFNYKQIKCISDFEIEKIKSFNVKNLLNNYKNSVQILKNR